MKPGFLVEMEEAFSVNQHVLLTLNTEDRFFCPEEQVPPCNLNYFIAQYFSRAGYRVAQYMPSMGVRELSPTGQTSPSLSRLGSEQDPVGIMNGLAGLLRNDRERWLVMFLHAERVAPAPGGAVHPSQSGAPFAEILHTLMLDDGIAQGPSRIVLLTYCGMPDDLLVRTRGCRVIPVGLPTSEERLGFIEFIDGLGGDGKPFAELDEGLEREEVARLTAGMTLAGIETVFRSAGHCGVPLSRDTIRLAKAREIRSLSRDLLDVSEPQEGFESVAGLTSVKSYFTELIPQIRSGQPGVPQAILLQGVPGCGKSHFVKALAGELVWPLLEMRNVRDAYVGNSEKNLKHVIDVVEQLPHVVLYFDEIDQSLGQRGTGVSGDSGTSERMLAMIFSWLGSLHLRGRVLFIGATNRPDLLDPALLDRFGVSIPFLKPGTEELAPLIPLLLGRFRRGLTGIDPVQASAILREKSPTGRTVQEILIDAGLRADRERGRVGSDIEARHLAEAADNVICREDDVEMEFIALTALALCSFQSLLPWNDHNGLRTGAEIPENLLSSGIVGRDGRLDRKRLHETISGIRRQRTFERVSR